jgi:folylpolyglutamate synthase/dihydropteroate synthase
MQALVESYQAQYSGQKATVVLALKDSKEYKDVVDILLPITANFIFTTFTTNRNLPAHACPPQKLAAYCDEIDFKNYAIEPDLTNLSQLLKNQINEPIIITGSFYMLSQLRDNNHIS